MTAINDETVGDGATSTRELIQLANEKLERLSYASPYDKDIVALREDVAECNRKLDVILETFDTVRQSLEAAQNNPMVRTLMRNMGQE